METGTLLTCLSHVLLTMTRLLTSAHALDLLLGALLTTALDLELGAALEAALDFGGGALGAPTAFTLGADDLARALELAVTTTGAHTS